MRCAGLSRSLQDFHCFQDVARLLLERGADPNKRYFFGAEINLANDIESLELLLNFGANTETRDRSGLTPLMRYARSSSGMEAVLLLLKYGADVNAMADGRNDFRTVLHYAILSGEKIFPLTEFNAPRTCTPKTLLISLIEPQLTTPDLVEAFN